MRSRIISKTKFICDFVTEKFWNGPNTCSICSGEERCGQATSPSYHIYKKHRGVAFVEDFLKERRRVLNINRYKMEIKTVDEDCDTNTIGQVLLHRKNKLICQATLKTKESDSPDCKLIYWSFEK